MKLNTLQRFDFTADLYEARLVDSGTGAGNTTQFTFTRVIKCKVFALAAGGDLTLYCPEALQIGSRITNVKDANGNLLTGGPSRPQGQQYDVLRVDPVLNPFGLVDTNRFECAVVR